MARQTNIKLRRSATQGSIPTTSNLDLGELAINTYDGKLYVRRDNGSQDDILQVGSSSYLYNYHTDDVQTLTVTVASKDSSHRYHGSGSGSGYKINGIFSPYFKLVPGITYKFDQSDSSNSGHPLRFYYEADKTTAYTTGVTTAGTPGSSGAYTQILATDSTPEILHYQCSAHGYMGNQVSFDTRTFTGLTTDTLTEGSTNLYFTNARARSAISAGGDLSYNSSTGVISFTQRTDAQVRGLVSVTDAGGDGSLAYNNSTGVITYTGPSASEVQAHFSGGTGVTISSGSIAIGQAVATTDSPTFAGATLNKGSDSSDALRISGGSASRYLAISTFSNGGNAGAGIALNASSGSGAFKFQVAGSDMLTLDSSGNAVITGNLTVQGTTTTLNTATLDVEDKNITLNYGSGDTSSLSLIHI